jgi:hypothetical protein
MVLYCPLCLQLLLKSVANVKKCLRSYEESKTKYVEYNRMEIIHFFIFFQFLKNKKRRRRRTTKTDNGSQ